MNDKKNMMVTTMQDGSKEEVEVLLAFKFNDNTANAKSVLSVLGACVKCGDEIEFMCEGEDEEAALSALVSAVEGGLGE